MKTPSKPSPTSPLAFVEFPEAEMKQNAQAFYTSIRSRRTVRNFDPRPIPSEILENCVLAAGTAPNGANLQPWHFSVVTNPTIKSEIRQAAEAEEHEFYTGRASEEWLDALVHLNTDEHKPFLENAPALIAIFRRGRVLDHDGVERKTYYPIESTGIATGFLIAALHSAGLATLTHTPSPMHFLNKILGRPKTDKPFLLLVVGYPAKDCEVPKISKKPLSEIASFH